ncbi:PilZ domain-containing protein [Thermodesulfobacteriota bacterium]
MSTERRKQPRHKLKVEAKVATPDGSISVIVTDISGEGVHLLSPKAIQSGTKVMVSLLIEDEASLSGSVAWILDSYIRGQHVYQIGVEIEAVILPEINAIGFHEKAEMVQEILSRVNSTAEE